MRQCVLSLGTTRQVAWIPEEFCRVGKHLEIQGENGWRIESVHGRLRPEILLTTDGRDLRQLFGSL